MNMTEKEWLECTDPILYFTYLKRSKIRDRVATERKVRLLRVACCRRIWRLIDNELCREAVEVVEQFADGRVSAHRHGLTRTAARRAADEYAATARDRAAALAVRSAAYCLEKRKLGWDLSSAAGALALEAEGPGDEVGHGSRAVFAAEQAAQAALLRDIFGNPFRPVAFDPAWRTSDVMLLANGIYAERAFDRMPILADALQDAGCDADALLAHFRDTSATHVRGCWALDLVLGKE
jgi:hypothetical protein